MGDKKNQVMKATELRIGNHIRYRNEFIQTQATDILSADLSPSDFSAISITKDRLMKFGFSEGFNDTFLINRYNANGKCTGSFVIKKIKDDFYFEKETLLKLEFIHDLQNLYFALEREELKTQQ